MADRWEFDTAARARRAADRYTPRVDATDDGAGWRDRLLRRALTVDPVDDDGAED